MLKKFPHKRVSKEDNFSYLLYSLIFLLFSNAFIGQFFARSLLGQSLVLAFTVITMLIGVWSVRSNAFAFKSSIGLVLSTIVISSLVTFLGISGLKYFHLLFMLIFFSITLKIASEQVIFSDKVTKNNIIGSICIFLLLGLLWAILYIFASELTTNAFSGLSGEHWQDNFPDLIYFSFVTLTTLGFGDLLPLSPIARFLTYIEAIIGVFYMAIIVSSLVSAAINAPKDH